MSKPASSAHVPMTDISRRAPPPANIPPRGDIDGWSDDLPANRLPPADRIRDYPPGRPPARKKRTPDPKPTVH